MSNLVNPSQFLKIRGKVDKQTETLTMDSKIIFSLYFIQMKSFFKRRNIIFESVVRILVYPLIFTHTHRHIYIYMTG